MAILQEDVARKPGFGLRFLMALILVPLGIAMRILAQIYLEITQEAVHYWNLLGFVAISHIALVLVSISAVLAYRRRPLPGIIAVQLWAGYGIGVALLAIKDMG